MEKRLTIIKGDYNLYDDVVFSRRVNKKQRMPDVRLNEMLRVIVSYLDYTGAFRGKAKYEFCNKVRQSQKYFKTITVEDDTYEMLLALEMSKSLEEKFEKYSGYKTGFIKFSNIFPDKDYSKLNVEEKETYFNQIHVLRPDY